MKSWVPKKFRKKKFLVLKIFLVLKNFLVKKILVKKFKKNCGQKTFLIQENLGPTNFEFK